MTNMEHVRFTNTAEDLDDCWAHLYDDDLSDEENEARERLIRLCKNIASENEDDEEA
jgi:hypothetical protein